MTVLAIGNRLCVYCVLDYFIVPCIIPVIMNGIKVKQESIVMTGGVTINHTETAMFYCGNGQEPQNRVFKCDNGAWIAQDDDWIFENNGTFPHCRNAKCQADCNHGNNNGTCVRDYVCFCNVGYTGIKCELQSAKCEADCNNHGTCVRDNVCECNVGYTGIKCDPAKCEADCNNHGTCVRDNVFECNVGYTGIKCDPAKCEADCNNHGTCVRDNVCECNVGYTGIKCDPAKCEADCNNHGTCVRDNVCKCNVGYTGIKCDPVLCSIPTNIKGIIFTQEGVLIRRVSIKHTETVTFSCGKGMEPQGREFECDNGDWIAEDDDKDWTFENNGILPQCRNAKCEAKCNNHGTCVKDNLCECNVGYTGSICDKDAVEESTSLTIILAVGVSVGLVIFAVILISKRTKGRFETLTITPNQHIEMNIMLPNAQAVLGAVENGGTSEQYDDIENIVIARPIDESSTYNVIEGHEYLELDTEPKTSQYLESLTAAERRRQQNADKLEPNERDSQQTDTESNTSAYVEVLTAAERRRQQNADNLEPNERDSQQTDTDSSTSAYVEVLTAAERRRQQNAVNIEPNERGSQQMDTDSSTSVYVEAARIGQQNTDY